MSTPRAFLSREVMSSGGLCHVPFTYTVLSPAFSRWTLLSISWRRILGERLRKWLPLIRKRCAVLAGRQMDNCVCGLRGKHWRQGQNRARWWVSPPLKHTKSTRWVFSIVRVEGLHNIEDPLYFPGLESALESWKNSQQTKNRQEAI